MLMRYELIQAFALRVGIADVLMALLQVRTELLEALKYCSSSSLHESSLCVRAQMELASLAIDARDSEGGLKRLEWAKSMVHEKAQVLGSPGISPSM